MTEKKKPVRRTAPAKPKVVPEPEPEPVADAFAPGGTVVGVADYVDEPSGFDVVAVIAQALVLEEPLRRAADAYPSGDNTDAVKAALRNASHGIAHIRKVYDANRRLAR